MSLTNAFTRVSLGFVATIVLIVGNIFNIGAWIVAYVAQLVLKEAGKIFLPGQVQDTHIWMFMGLCLFIFVTINIDRFKKEPVRREHSESAPIEKPKRQTSFEDDEIEYTLGDDGELIPITQKRKN